VASAGLESGSTTRQNTGSTHRPPVEPRGILQVAGNGEEEPASKQNDPHTGDELVEISPAYESTPAEGIE